MKAHWQAELENPDCKSPSKKTQAMKAQAELENPVMTADAQAKKAQAQKLKQN